MIGMVCGILVGLFLLISGIALVIHGLIQEYVARRRGNPRN